MATSIAKMELAETQLERVQSAWDPPDWLDLSHFGFHALENAVDAASLRVGLPIERNHPSRVSAAQRLHSLHGLKDISELLMVLNEVRKREAYGDVEAPELDPEDTAIEIELYVTSVREFLAEFENDA